MLKQVNCRFRCVHAHRTQTLAPTAGLVHLKIQCAGVQRIRYGLKCGCTFKAQDILKASHRDRGIYKIHSYHPRFGVLGPTFDKLTCGRNGGLDSCCSSSDHGRLCRAQTTGEGPFSYSCQINDGGNWHVTFCAERRHTTADDCARSPGSRGANYPLSALQIARADGNVILRLQRASRKVLRLFSPYSWS